MLVTNPDGRDGAPVDGGTVQRELAEICATFGKSDVSRRLLTYLVDCHLKGKVPRETDVALDVFHRDASFDGAQDAVVRVAVRTLRQKMEEYYRGAGESRPLRFEVPRGSYRVTITAADAPLVPEPGASAAPGRPGAEGPAGVGPGWLLGGLLALIGVGAMAWLVGRATASPPAPPPLAAAGTPAATSPLWQPLLGGSRPIVVVLGDLLLFPNLHAEPGRVQLIRDSRINTRDELREYLGGVVTSSQSGPGTNVATTLVPMSVAYGLVDVLPVLAGVGRPFEVRVFDELQVDKLRTHDVIYIGPLVAIGPLGDALFRNSNYQFDFDGTSRRLHNRQTGRDFRPTRGRQESSNDFGLFASFRGPEGNRIIVFTSAGSDLGLLPLVRAATSAEGLAQLTKMLTQDGKLPLPDEFEALMSVSGYYRTDLAAQFIEAQARPGPRRAE